MKKVFSLFMALLFAISLFACGKEESKEPTVPTPATPEQVTPTETPVIPSETPTQPEVPDLPIELEVEQLKQNYRHVKSLAIKKNMNNGKAPHSLYLDSWGEWGFVSGDEWWVYGMEIRTQNSEDPLFSDLDAEYYEHPLLDLREGDYYFDVYIRAQTRSNNPIDYTKTTLKISCALMSLEFLCGFYDEIYPMLEIGEQYEMVIFARKGDTIVGWGEDWFVWSEQNEADYTKVIDTDASIIK